MKEGQRYIFRTINRRFDPESTEIKVIQVDHIEQKLTVVFCGELTAPANTQMWRSLQGTVDREGVSLQKTKVESGKIVSFELWNGLCRSGNLTEAPT